MIRTKVKLYAGGVTYTVPVRVEKVEDLPAKVAELEAELKVGHLGEIVVTGD